MPKNGLKQKIYQKIKEEMTSTPESLKKYQSVPIMNLPITVLLFESKEIEELIQKEEEEKEYTIGNYLIKGTLGQGTFGKVKLGIYLPNKEKVAVKILEKDRIIEKDDEIRVKREFDMLAKFNHPNVILVAEIFESCNSYFSVMEYCEGGELFNYIVNKQKLSEEEAAFFYYQLINGLEYIHSLGIVHRDLKPENLLITSEHILKIIDFGLSNYFTNDENQKLLITPCGSPCYASPEMVAGKKYNGFKIDIWATGIILYAMLCGYLPFEDRNNDDLFKKILECKVKFPKFIGEKSKDLIQKILVNDPEKRISIPEIKAHPFYLQGKKMFELEFSLCHNSSDEGNLKIKNANENENENVNIILDNLNEKETKETYNQNNEKLNDIEYNIILTLPQDAIYKPLKTEYMDKSCQFYSDYQNSEHDANIAVEENDNDNDICEKDNLEDKNKKKLEEKNKNKNLKEKKEKKNSKSKSKSKSKNKRNNNKKETSVKKNFLREKSKSKELIKNGKSNNILRKDKENALKKNKFRLLLLKNNYNVSKNQKTNINTNLKKKGHSAGLTNIIKKYYNKKNIKKEKPKLNININNINNYMSSDLNNNNNNGNKLTSSEKKKKIKSIDISKNNFTYDDKRKNNLEKDNINKDKEKNNSNKKSISHHISSKYNEKKSKYITKNLISELEFCTNINNNKNDSNKYYEDNLLIDNRRLKTEVINNKNIENEFKKKKTINSKNNTTINTIHNNSNMGNSKNNNNNNNANMNNLKGKELFGKKTQKKYFVDFNGHKRRINIVAGQKMTINSKSIKKTTPQKNHKKINIIKKNIDIDKAKKDRIQIIVDENNEPDNYIIIDKGLKTEVDHQEKKSNNMGDKIKKNHNKSSSNVNKLNNLIHQNIYNKALNIPLNNIYGAQKIKKNISNLLSSSNNNTNNLSYSKNKKNKNINIGLILRNNNNFSNNNNNNVVQKVKVNTNPNITNNTNIKSKILSYNNIPKKKKELIIRNTVINFNVVNSSLIISSLNKKRRSIFFCKHNNSKKSMNNNQRNHINKTLNNALTSGVLKKNKSKEKINAYIKNYTSNIKKNKNIICHNSLNNNLLNYSENVAKTENNETPIAKIKNKLEKILLNKLKQNNSQDKKTIINKMLKQKSKDITKHNSDKFTNNSNFTINKSISPVYKNVRTINDENNSNKKIYVKKHNKLAVASQSFNGQKRNIKKVE